MTAGTDTETIEQATGRLRSRGQALLAALRKVWRAVTFGGFSSLARRIVFLNVVGLAALVVAILILNQSRSSLIDAEVRSLTAQGELIANSLAAQAAEVRGTAALRAPQDVLDLDAIGNILPDVDFPIDPTQASTLIRYLSDEAGPRVRVYDKTGYQLVDSDQRSVLRTALPPPGANQPSLLERIWQGLTNWFRRKDLPVYIERGTTDGLGYEEVAAAVDGTRTTLTRVTSDGELLVSVAVPIQAYQSVQGAVLLTTRPGTIDTIIREERNQILRVFAVAAIVSGLLSFLLAGTIATPLRRLAAAADRVRKGIRTRPQIPDYSKRRDEIGDLSLAFRDMTSSLYARIEAIERFAADVAHELKNPLTSLRSAVETLPLAKTPESRQRLLDVIQHDVRRLDRLISDISDASRLDAEFTREDAEPIDIVRLIETLVTLAEETAGPDSAKVALTVGEGGDDAFLVLGHDTRLSQVFNNLIDNARSFSPPGGTIAISLRRRGNEVEIRVEDSGPGIRAEKIERIFERFYTDRPEGESFGQNSGLGLSISQQIVEGHGGTIWGENITETDRQTGETRVRGARFVVRLPAAGK